MTNEEKKKHIAAIEQLINQELPEEFNESIKDRIVKVYCDANNLACVILRETKVAIADRDNDKELAELKKLAQ